ncbi:hypothetical protein [Streptomyces sp. NBC_00470]|uniref:hypothetical protein n=1 Tax=Streptomyces sp. NBC_00470 TaxID=2975753 RepID=UPI002F907942
MAEAGGKPFFHNRFEEHQFGCPTCTTAAAAATVAAELAGYCPEGTRLSSRPDTSHIRTSIGPRPPSRPRDVRTFMWSRCTLCGWYACHPEDQQAMEHTMRVTEHAQDGCATQDGQLSFLTEQAQDGGAAPDGQLALLLADLADT